MAKLRAVAPRIYLDTNPYVERIPVYNDTIFYPAGSIVSQYYQINDSDSDTVFYNFYFANRDIPAGGGDPKTNTNWLPYAFGDPKLSLLFSDSEVFTFVEGVDSDYKVAFAAVDSDVDLLTSKVRDVYKFDSDIKAIQRDIAVIEERNLIDSLTDSDAVHNAAIAWDSQTQRFKFVRPVQTVNNVAPNSQGNVSVEFTKASSGTRDQRPDSDANGSIYVVIGDSDSTVDGITYSFISKEVGWVRVIGYTEIENDALYVNITGDTMTGPLVLSRDPLSDSEAATKRYVDGFNDSDKQDRIIYVADLTAMYALIPENNRLYYVRSTNELWTYYSGGFHKFTIPAQRIYDPVMLEASITGTGAANFFLCAVRTYRFSDFLEGQMYAEEEKLDGTVTRKQIAIQSNGYGTFDFATTQYNGFKLADANNQLFVVSVLTKYIIGYKYYLTHIAHDGKISRIQMDADPSTVAFDEVNRTLNFGEY